MSTTVTIYELIGGEPALRSFTRRFYALMDSLPEAAACRAVHPASLEGSEAKFFDYLTGWLGGPPVYVQKNGPPMLRARHLHAPIGPEEIEGWLACFRQAWAETIRNEAATAAVTPRVEALARHMHNRPEGAIRP